MHTFRVVHHHHVTGAVLVLHRLRFYCLSRFFYRPSFLVLCLLSSFANAIYRAKTSSAGYFVQLHSSLFRVWQIHTQQDQMYIKSYASVILLCNHLEFLRVFPECVPPMCVSLVDFLVLACSVQASSPNSFVDSFHHFSLSLALLAENLLPIFVCVKCCTAVPQGMQHSEPS